jgi:putative oxygen-independent coproporphyrinogen III oxidase
LQLLSLYKVTYNTFVTLSFYAHIPYCVKRCGYCDFNTYTPGELKEGSDIAQVSNGYIDLLIQESKIARTEVDTKEPIPTIFFGGGTPTLMEPADLGRVLKSLESDFGFAKDIEITIEANPDTVSKEKLEALRNVGINRISFGMQSAAPHVLAVLDRTHNPENVVKATKWAREVGFEQVSVDLIYGTPGESIADWEATIDSALALPINHISAYALIVENGTKLAAQVKRGEIVIPDDDQTADKYLLADEKFSKAGFTWYELSNWAKPGSECRHNIAYWQGANWWGLGPGAHSHIDGKRFWNVKHPNAYRERLELNQSPIMESEVLVADQIESERVMLAIRLPAGISKASLTSQSLARIESYVTAGQLSAESWEAGVISLTRSGRLMADRIVREILM